MNAEEARKIVEDYKACIAKGTEGETILRRVSWLPYSKGKIKYAYFVLLEDIVRKEGRLGSDLRENLVETYGVLNNFIGDDLAEKYAKNYQDWQSKKLDVGKNKKDERLIKQYFAYTHMLRSGNLFDEINDYIKELIEQK